MQSGVSAIVLAAGMSTRMGRVKQLLPVQGEPLLQIVLDTLSQTAVDEIVLVLGFEADEIRRHMRLGSARVVINEAFRQGMSTSLRAGISNLAPEAQAALIVLADQPFLQSQTIDHLIAKYLEAKPKIAIPTHEGSRGNPVLVDRCLFPELKGLTGDVGFRATFGKHARDILEVPVNDRGILLDLDTAVDLENIDL